MDAGWTVDQVERHIRNAWRTHELTHDMEPAQKDLLESLVEVYKLADEGWAPRQCAVVYRSLFRANPTRYWLEDWAERLEQDAWESVVLP